MSAYEPVSLDDGHWVSVRGVRKWVSGARSPVVVVAEPERPVAKVDVTKLRACLYCDAKVNETCKSVTGNTVKPHLARLTGRLCPCGALLVDRKLYCEPCRVKARKQTYRLREIRKPTRARRAS